NSLAQTLLKLTVPGVPDFYQGTELWDLALVDPDNRRPVDFPRRQALLEALRARIAADAAAGADATSLCAELLAHWPDGRVKLYLTHRALTLRRERAPLFAVGGYRALGADGPGADHLLALARADGTDAVVAAVPRLTVRQGGLTGRILLGAPAWEHTAVVLAEDLAGVYRDRFTGLTVPSERRDGLVVLPAGALFAHFPVALLERVAPPAAR
ncbi:MAG TPA: malto-oligosyltrehalose synthase, partial [Candidatus Dormibacteraeota bacterium]|nr:malto-oligosyltrehalose synthase [Candidatus Dormibacteraeota bacterium]